MRASQTTFINKSNNYSSGIKSATTHDIWSLKQFVNIKNCPWYFGFIFTQSLVDSSMLGCKEGPRFLYTKNFQWNGIFFSHLFRAHHLLKNRGKAFRTNICNKIWTKQTYLNFVVFYLVRISLQTFFLVLSAVLFFRLQKIYIYLTVSILTRRSCFCFEDICFYV